MSSVRKVSSPSRGLSGMMAFSICSGESTASCSLGCEWTAYCYINSDLFHFSARYH